MDDHGKCSFRKSQRTHLQGQERVICLLLRRLRLSLGQQFG